jgi:hypothetical protein
VTTQQLENYIDQIQDFLHDLGVPGILSSRKDLHHVEKLYDSGAPLDVVLRGMLIGFERRTKSGKDVQKLGDLLPTIRSEVRRAGIAEDA